MLLQIKVTKENILMNEGDTIIVRIDNHVARNPGCYLTTVPGETLDDFHKNRALHQSGIWIGQKGGIKNEPTK